MSEVNHDPSKKLLFRWEIIIMLCQEILNYKTQSQDTLSEVLRAGIEMNKLAEQAKNLERLYQSDHSTARGSDHKTDIQCIADKIKQFTKEKRFYQLFQAIHHIHSEVQAHFDEFPSVSLGKDVFFVVNQALESFRKFVQISIDAFSELPNIINIDKYTKKNQMEQWIRVLDPFAQYFDRIIPFLSYDALQLIKSCFEEISLKARNLEQFFDENQSFSKKDEYRRKLIYISQSILYVIYNEEKTALEEDEEICQFADSLGAIAY
jgi:hypothetical protein